jgi:hypothetical protein
VSNKLNDVPLDLLAAEMAKAYKKIAEGQDRRFKRMGAAMAKPLDPEYYEGLYQSLRDK